MEEPTTRSHDTMLPTSATTASTSSSSSTSILSEKVQRALQIQTNTTAMKAALEALGQLSSSGSSSSSSGSSTKEFALDARSVRHAIEYDALQQALSLRHELTLLCDSLKELRQGISQTAQFAHQVKQAIQSPVVVVNSNTNVVNGATSSLLVGSLSKTPNSMLPVGEENDTIMMEGSSSATTTTTMMNTGGGGGGNSSSTNSSEQDEERLAATLAEAFTKRNMAKERLDAVHHFLETFDLSEQDSRLLDHYNFDDLDVSLMEGGTPVNGTAFLNALERVKQIRQELSKTFGSSTSPTGNLSLSPHLPREYGGRTLSLSSSSSSSLGASSALRMMEHLAQKQEQAFERLYHWLQSHLQLFAVQPSSSLANNTKKKRMVAFENESSFVDDNNDNPDSMDQALQHPFFQASLYTLRHVPAFYRHMLELIASRRRQEETRIFLLALTSGYNLRLMYGSCATNGRHTECPRFTQLMYRTCQHYGRRSEHQELTKHRPKLPTCDWN